VETKTLKISADIYEYLMFCRDIGNTESMNDVILRLLKEYLHRKSEIVRNGDDFYLIIDGRNKKIPVFSSPNKIIRIHKTLHAWLNTQKCHPDESYNTLLFKMISCHYRNKPVYRIFGGEGCGLCADLEEYVKEELMEIQEIHDGLFVEKLRCHDYMPLMKKYDVDLMPLSILYNADGEVVWYAKGGHNKGKVKLAIEGVIK
jgi:hypothetical protein